MTQSNNKDAKSTDKPEPRLIKKYPNRRLYDTEISRYITLDEVRDLVMQGHEFKVIDKKTGRDITRSILLQVIAEQEEGNDPVFSTDYLSNVIRFYGDSLQNSMSDYLEHSMQHFVEQQAQIREKLKSLVGNNPIEAIRDLARQNRKKLKSIRQEIVEEIDKITRRSDD